MIDLFAIVNKGGIVLWKKTNSLVNLKCLQVLFHEAFLSEQRTVNNTVTFDRYTMQYQEATQYSIVFVVSLIYCDLCFDRNCQLLYTQNEVQKFFCLYFIFDFLLFVKVKAIPLSCHLNLINAVEFLGCVSRFEMYGIFSITA